MMAIALMAMQLADAIFRQAGIAPVWFHCGLADGKWPDSSDRCQSGVGPDGITVRLRRSSGLDASNRLPRRSGTRDRP